MKLRSGSTYWLQKNNNIPVYPPLRSNLTCDIAIVGGGITGSLMAYQFSSEGYKTIVIDKRDISQGSTGATTALLQYELDEPLYTLIKKVGEEAAVNTYAAGVKAIKDLSHLVDKIKIPCEFGLKESLFIAQSPSDAKALTLEFKCRKKFGFDVRWLGSLDLKTRFGINGAGGILSAVGASMDAYQFSHNLYNYSAAHYNLSVFGKTDMKAVEYGPTNNKIYTDNDNCITCQKIIYATGYETQLFLKNKIVDLISTYVCITKPVKGLPLSLSNTIFWDTEKPYFYVRSTSDGRILMGGEDEEFKDPEKRDQLISQKEKDLLKKLKGLLPNLKVSPAISWAGTFGVTKDSLPYIGCHPEYPSSYFVLGFGGNGITFSLMGMTILSDAVAGRPNPLLEYFKFKR